MRAISAIITLSCTPIVVGAGCDTDESGADGDGGTSLDAAQGDATAAAEAGVDASTPIPARRPSQAVRRSVSSRPKRSKISNDSLPAGTYYAWAQRYNDTKTSASYRLDLTVQ